MGNTKVSRFRRERIWRYAPLIIWIGIIFIASSNTGSASNTSRIIRPLLLFFFPDITDAAIALIQVYVRKSAHFVFYFILGSLAARAFSHSANKLLNKFWLPTALALVVLVGSLDETNQSFLASRSSSIYDVMIDAAGGLTAILLFAVYYKLKLESPR